MKDTGSEENTVDELFLKCGRKVEKSLSHWRLKKKCPSSLPADAREIRGMFLFMEAFGQMIDSTFLGEDDVCVLEQVGEGEGHRTTGARFSSPAVVKDYFAPFRRIWLNDEPCNFGAVCGVFTRYGTDENRVSAAAQQAFLFAHNMRLPPFYCEGYRNGT